MKISSLKNLFAVILLAGIVLTAAPDSVVAAGIETGGESEQNDLNIQEGEKVSVGDSAVEAGKSIIKNGVEFIWNVATGQWIDAAGNAFKTLDDIDLSIRTAGGTEYTYTDPFTGERKTYVLTIFGEKLSREGNTKGCMPLPIKLIEEEKCIFCPLFEVLFNAANTMSSMSFQKLAEPFSIVMLIGFAIWIALKVIAHVSSLTKQDAPKFLVGLLNESFKVMLAYLLLTNAHAIYSYAISPILSAGLDFGSAVLFNTDNFSNCAATSVTDDGRNLLPASLYTKLDCFIKAIQKEISFMQAVGSTLMCVGRHEGKLKGIIWDFGMVFQGLILYLFAIALSLAFAFYLIDATVQLGIVGVLMPMLIACWPFGPTRKYTSKGWEMFLNTFFTYVFLGIVVSVNMQLVGQAMTNSGEAAASVSNKASPCNGEESGLKALACVINNSDIETLKRMTDLGFGGFLILLCCCIFGFKFTNQSTTLANSMASGGVSGIGNKIGGLAASGAGKLAAKATKPARDAVSRVGRRVADGAGRAIGSGAKMVGSAIASSKAGRAVKSVAGSGLKKAANVAGKALGVRNQNGQNGKTKNNPLARQMVASMLRKSRQLKGQSGSGTRGGGTNNAQSPKSSNNNSTGNSFDQNNQTQSAGGNQQSHSNRASGNTGTSNRSAANNSQSPSQNKSGQGQQPQTGGGNGNGTAAAANDDVWNNYSTDKIGDIVYNEKGEIVSSNTYTADGRLRREYSKDKAGNEHYKEYDKQGKLCGTRDINKDGSERGWSKTGDYSTQWHHNADGSGSSTNFYKGSKCGGSETDKDGNETSWGV